jgi:sugar lactone lactonase YvrE
MRAFIKIFAITVGVLIPGLFPVASLGDEALKFRHVTSIYSDDQELRLKQPEGVACNENSDLIVADTGNGRLLRFVFNGKTVKQVAQEIKMPQLTYPVMAKMNSNGEIFALDGRQRRIIRISAAGKFSGFVDSSPVASGPKSFDIDKNDGFYILDIFSGRVIALNPLGKYLKHFKFPEEYGFISDLTVDYRGNIFLIDSVNARIFSVTKNASAFSPLTGSLKEYMRFPTRITTDKRGRIYLVDRNGGRVIILGQDGSYLGRLSAMGWKEGLLNYPSQMCLNDRGEIFVADTNNSRVQIFTMIE